MGVLLRQQCLEPGDFDMRLLLPLAGLEPSGVLTPASALGMLLVDRLRRAGFKFDITSG